MVKIEQLLKEGKVSRINELELDRYVNFFNESYRDNLGHSKLILKEFPRWSIISGYYAMHDITKLLLAKKFMLKVDFEVHSTTIKCLRELIKTKELVAKYEEGYKEFISLANDLAEAKKERVKVQYYTSTEFMKKEYRKRAENFLKLTVSPYLDKIKALLEK